MLNIQIDHHEVKELYIQKLNEKIREVDAELVFWDANELKRRTCMCWNTIQKEFFYDSRFPKHKVGNKWFFPAQETKQFLLKWLSERGF
jgi:hypothetical protein